MKLTKKKIFLLIFAFSILIYFFASKVILTDNKKGIWFDKIHQNMPESVKKFLKKTVFIIPDLKRKLKNEKKKVAELKALNQKYKEIYLENFYENIDSINFNLMSENSIQTNSNKFNLKKFQNDSLMVGKNKEAQTSAYIEFYDGNLFLIDGNGLFSYIENFNEINDSFKSKVIKTNFKDFLNNKEFFSSYKYGVKDIYIDDNKIFLSFTNKQKQDCYNTAVLFGELNYNYINFEKFFYPNECIARNSEICLFDFNAHASGGRIVGFKDNKILLSVGSYLCKEMVQKNKSIFGKIISIDIENKKYSIISKGHRNPQGLYYDFEDNIIISTEHGPYGGDEINIISEPGNKIKNYGWPISSYGEHYSTTIERHKAKGTLDKLLEISPLHKSHKKYGFEEPIKYFSPSIGISEVIKVKDFEESVPTNDYFATSMGRDLFEGDLSIHHIKMDKKNSKILNHEIIPIGERIRDIKFIKETKSIILFLETSGSIGVLKFN